MKENNTVHDSVVVNSEQLSSTEVKIELDKLNEIPFRALSRFSSNEDIIDSDVEKQLTSEIISRYLKDETSPYWAGFDLYNANRFQLKDYIMERATFDKSAPIPDRMHYIIYMIVNKINDKIYIGQHQTEFVLDTYMGSGEAIQVAEKKYGIENFEKVIVHDFETWEEMDRQ